MRSLQCPCSLQAAPPPPSPWGQLGRQAGQVVGGEPGCSPSAVSSSARPAAPRPSPAQHTGTPRTPAPPGAPSPPETLCGPQRGAPAGPPRQSLAGDTHSCDHSLRGREQAVGLPRDPERSCLEEPRAGTRPGRERSEGLRVPRRFLLSSFCLLRGLVPYSRACASECTVCSSSSVAFRPRTLCGTQGKRSLASPTGTASGSREPPPRGGNRAVRTREQSIMW